MLPMMRLAGEPFPFRNRPIPLGFPSLDPSRPFTLVKTLWLSLWASARI